MVLLVWCAHFLRCKLKCVIAVTEKVQSRHPLIVLLGDSTMHRTAQALSDILDNCTLARSGNRCDFPSYFGIPYDKFSLNISIPHHVGPTANGRRHRGCQDCSGCAPRRWNCNHIDIEYLGIEFAEDVEYPTLNHPSTQSSIIIGYLKKIARAGDFVVFNTGIHDTVSTGKDSALYGKQLEGYLDMLLQVYSNAYICWVTSTYPRGVLQPPEWRAITSTEAVARFNVESRRIVTKKKIKVLDVAMLSTLPCFQALYVDAVHVGNESQPWYRSVAFSILVEYSGLLSSPLLWYRSTAHLKQLRNLSWKILGRIGRSFNPRCGRL